MNDGWNKEELVERFPSYDEAINEIARLGRQRDEARKMVVTAYDPAWIDGLMAENARLRAAGNL